MGTVTGMGMGTSIDTRTGRVMVLGIEAFGSGLPHSGSPPRHIHAHIHAHKHAHTHAHAGLSGGGGERQGTERGTGRGRATGPLVYHDFAASWLLVDGDSEGDGETSTGKYCDAVGCGTQIERASARTWLQQARARTWDAVYDGAIAQQQ